MASRERKGRPRFKRYPKANDADSFFRQAEAKYDPRRRHLYVNTPAAKIIEQAIAEARPDLPPQYFDGVTIGAPESAMVAHRLHAFVTSQILPNLKETFLHLAEEFSLALAGSRVITVINADPAHPAMKIREAEQEEEFHRALIESTGGGFSPQFLIQLFNRPEIERAVRQLRRLRPDIATRLQGANELAFVLKRGGWKKIGVTDDEACALWYYVAKLLIEHHGDRAWAILKHGHPLYAQRVARRIKRELEVPKPRRKKATAGRSDKARG